MSRVDTAHLIPWQADYSAHQARWKQIPGTTAQSRIPGAFSTIYTIRLNSMPPYTCALAPVETVLYSAGRRRKSRRAISIPC